MNDADRREVIMAIGAEGNQLVGGQPRPVGGGGGRAVRFVDPGAPVRDVVTGGNAGSGPGFGA